MEKQTITIYDVAREANVSMATVSRVVNGNPNVKPATRKKVLDVIDELDYRPNAVARGLASKKTTTVGVIIPDVTNLQFASLARGIDDIATMYKYNIILANSDQNNHKEAVQKLIENGHKNIAFVTASLKNTFASDLRLDGYKEALSAAKIKYNEKFVFEIPLTYQSGEVLSEKLLNAGITAAVVTDDEAAVGLLNGLYDRGVNVPKEFEVISSNNSKLTKMARPTLTTIAPPLYDIGAVAMRLLTKIMNKEEVADTEITLPYKIEYRQTTK